MLSINLDIIYYFLNHLDLKNQTLLANTCTTLNRIFNNKDKLSERIKPEDLKLANARFFKNFFKSFTVDHLKCFNYQLISRQELEETALSSFPNGSHPTKMEIVAKFLHSLQNTSVSAMHPLKDGPSVPPYQHMWHDNENHFSLLQAIHKKLHGETLLKKKTADKIQSILTKENEKFIIDYVEQAAIGRPIDKKVVLFNLQTTLLHLVDDPRMQMTDAPLLEELYTSFWQQHSITHLNNLRTPQTHPRFRHTYMPLQMFQGLCHRIRTMSMEKFGPFQTWYLTEDHLQAWNATFEHRQVASLKVELIYEIKSATFKKFSQIVLNLPVQTEVEICYRIPRQEIHHETTRLFKDFESRMAQKNPGWNWSMMEN